jgi:predicted MFS family arabinose efflux permease
VQQAGWVDALRERDFRNVFLASAASTIGDQMVPVALSFAVLDLTGSVSDLGYVLAAGTVPLVVLLLAGGVLADRVSRRRLMISSDLVRLLAEGALAALILSGNARLWHLAVLQAVHGAASAFFQPASTGILPQIVPAERLQQANALRGLTMSIGGIAGPALAGVLVVASSPGWAIAFDAGSFAVSAFFLWRVHAPALSRSGEPATFLGDLLHGWREFRSRTWLWVIVVQFALLHIVTIPTFLALGALVSKRELGGAGAWSTILVLFSAGTLVGGLIGLRMRTRRPLLTATLWNVALALPSALLALRLGVAPVAAGAFVAGVGIAVFGVLWETTLQREVPPEVLSRVSAYDWFGSIATLPIGFALVGPLSSALGIAGTLWLGAAVALASTVAVVAVPDVRRPR